jgi:hypothetical protein
MLLCLPLQLLLMITDQHLMLIVVPSDPSDMDFCL